MPALSRYLPVANGGFLEGHLSASQQEFVG
jgi:hypothetical protein